MDNSTSRLKSLIAEMAEGDLEFQQELTNAIYEGLKELKERYLFGADSKNEEIIKQIRHKCKPTLLVFEFNGILDEIQHGKEILESTGFDTSFGIHIDQLISKIDSSLQEIHALV